MQNQADLPTRSTLEQGSASVGPVAQAELFGASTALSVPPHWSQEQLRDVRGRFMVLGGTLVAPDTTTAVDVFSDPSQTWAWGSVSGAGGGGL